MDTVLYEYHALIKINVNDKLASKKVISNISNILNKRNNEVIMIKLFYLYHRKYLHYLDMI